MSNVAKKTKKPVVVKKPYLTGSPWDHATIPSALKLLLAQVLVGLAYLFFSSAVLSSGAVLRFVVNVGLQAAVYAVFYLTGLSAGATDVNMGENMYLRRENGRDVSERELKGCFHPLKGFVKGAVGVLPLFLIALVLALIAHKQTTGIGGLPTWIDGYKSTTELGAALSYYNVQTPFSLEDILRVVVRLVLMPFVGVVTTSDTQGLLMLEHLSPVLVTLPCFFYGFGYSRGENERNKTHTAIARNNKKRARRQKKELQKRQEAYRKPQQLN